VPPSLAILAPALAVDAPARASASPRGADRATEGRRRVSRGRRLRRLGPRSWERGQRPLDEGAATARLRAPIVQAGGRVRLTRNRIEEGRGRPGTSSEPHRARRDHRSASPPPARASASRAAPAVLPDVTIAVRRPDVGRSSHAIQCSSRGRGRGDDRGRAARSASLTVRRVDDRDLGRGAEVRGAGRPRVRLGRRARDRTTERATVVPSDAAPRADVPWEVSPNTRQLSASVTSAATGWQHAQNPT
jgi:hypothetical protein